MEQNQPKVYIIVLNYVSWQDTIECLESLLNLTYQNKEIIVVDNNSPNDSFFHLTKWAENHLPTFLSLEEKEVPTHPVPDDFGVVFLKAAKNAGFAAGNNLGIRFALQINDAAYLWLLNNDTTVDSNSLRELVNRAENEGKQEPPVGIWGSKLLYYHQPSLVQGVGGKLNLRTFTTSHLHEGEPDSEFLNVASVTLDYVMGASLFVSRKFLSEVGLLSEDYFLYFEELDWAKRAQNAGFALGYVWSSRVYHKEGTTIGSSSSGTEKSDLADYHGIRSKIIFFKKFYPEKAFQLYALLMASALLRVSRLQFKRALTVFKQIAQFK
ncbi:glycosyltransferase family 2 protein [Rufibacter latericius]|uniref:Glycosyltransferase family 2 protein n=1 Tax=Rufibacter latericius TaxID=2487040 RepID=A0A3M9MA79_9BACT|nr:glycosyltransferase family 2 protein [Rufibacter latericius]RNI22454.1 glycosyltransferase family 2 protein [Rufibacter latericius]